MEPDDTLIRIVFIRHGQSTGNVGIYPSDNVGLELTKTGRQQAVELATSWNEPPSKVLISPFKRAQQTSEPTVDRFRHAPVETWPIQEFCYAEFVRWRSSSDIERNEWLDRFWRVADPDECDGPGAESFRTMITRARSILDRLEHLPSESLVYCFSHGQFIRALQTLVIDPTLNTHERMGRFWSFAFPPLNNCEFVTFEKDGDSWKMHLNEPVGDPRKGFSRLIS